MAAATFALILPAAGRSTRFGDPTQKKIYADLDGRAVWLRAIEPFIGRDDVTQIVLAIAAEDRELFDRRYAANAAFFNVRVIDGGAERVDSVARALEVVGDSCDFIAVHDAARPCVTPELVEAVFSAARQHGAALPGVAVADTLKRVGPDRTIVETVERAGLFGVQTPQAFERELLKRAYSARDQVSGPTDDARLVEALGHPVHVVDGSPFNLKITTAGDLRLASAILAAVAASRPAPAPRPFHDEPAGPEDGPVHRFTDLF